jgi:hypothetical protein
MPSKFSRHSYRICFFVFTVLTVVIACRHSGSNTLFRKISSGKSGIHFNNAIVENDSINPIDLEFLYNGGGVAAGDFNNDGMTDLYFTASTVSNKLYLNEGNFSFKDITDEANVTGENQWSNAASVIDINNDGWEDIYVCATIKKNPLQRKNILYINQGLNKNNVPVFNEMAKEYGLADTSYSVHAAFFDYDNDGDLDMYLLTTKLTQRDAFRFSVNKIDTNRADVDKLFRNDWNEVAGHPFFTDISKEAGIIHSGFGLGICVSDINKDGWKDIYIANDFFGDDLFYINNRNGTFTNKAHEYFKHTSRNAMGNDIADINNDGLDDIITVDMNPEDNYRKKKNMSGNNYYIYQNMLYENKTLQYVRNTLQLNMGPRINSNDSIGEPVFGDISFMTGVAETDWSWNPSIADFDNDGNRDIIITNGYPRDVTDHDFGAFRSKMSNIATKKQLIDEIPQIKIPNYAFRNKGNLAFDNVTALWGMKEPSFSNGAIYADLDNDGDLDYVINNINEAAFIYENTTNTQKKITANYLEVQFAGDEKNLKGIGAWAEIYYDKNKMQAYENNPYRGYLSTVDTKAFFGLGNISLIDSVIFRWPGNKKQRLEKVKANQILKADIKNAVLADNWNNLVITNNNIFRDITGISGINYRHTETDVIDFNTERLLPHKLSQYGPGLAAGDIDGNGLDDIFIGGTGDLPGTLLLQQNNGKFTKKEIVLPAWPDLRRPENMGVLLFDADGDGDPDLYCASGSNQFLANTKNYQDHFFVNDGRGNFTLDTSALPINHTSKSCIKASDFDNDGDLDLFLGGRVLPGKYPQPVSSFIYRNDSKDGKIEFTDVTKEVAPGLQQIGLVCDALWTDFDNDGFTDLIIAGEWMPVSFFKNDNGKLKNVTAQTGIGDQTGWWNSLAAGDFDNDGDIDYIAGNLGKNSFYRPGKEYPVSIYAKDFDNNGGYDAIPVVFLKDQTGTLKKFTAQNRDDIVEQLPVVKKRFLTYKDFATADIHKLFTPAELKDALLLQANNIASCLIINNGNARLNPARMTRSDGDKAGQGKFELHPLPAMAQLSPLYGMVVDDFNSDGNLDVAISGNDFGTEVTNGRYDALNGLLLLGDGQGNFIPQSILQSGLFIPGDGKALIKLKGADNNYLLAASQNRGPLKIFRSKNNGQKLIPVQSTDKMITITLKNGKTRKEELYYGTSFLSQSSRFICIDSTMRKVEIIDYRGNKREVRLD